MRPSPPTATPHGFFMSATLFPAIVICGLPPFALHVGAGVRVALAL